MKNIYRTILILAVVTLAGRAQVSNYANYGFGIQSPANSVRLIGMGNAGIAVRDSMSLNQANPALWQGFGSTSLQGQVYSSSLTVPELDYFGGIANFSGFSFKMPVGKRAGFAIGLAPLTRMKSSVDFADSLVFQGDQIDYTSKVELTGGLSELYIGGGYRISDWLAIGLKAKVLFGNYVVRNHTELVSDDDDLNSYYKRTLSINGNQISGGILFTDPGRRFNLAATVDLGARLKSWTTVENSYGPDTTDRSGDIEYPTIITVGTSLQLAKFLALNADLRYGIYSEDVFRNFYVFQQFTSESRNSLAAGIGFEKSPRRTLTSTFLQKMYYRGGFYYQTEPVYQNSGISEYGLTAGISMPFFNNLNRIDLALTYGLRKGFLSGEIGNEEVFSMHLGVTTGEPWFRRYKRR